MYIKSILFILYFPHHRHSPYPTAGNTWRCARSVPVCPPVWTWRTGGASWESEPAPCIQWLPRSSRTEQACWPRPADRCPSLCVSEINREKYSWKMVDSSFERVRSSICMELLMWGENTGKQWLPNSGNWIDKLIKAFYFSLFKQLCLLPKDVESLLIIKTWDFYHFAIN